MKKVLLIGIGLVILALVLPACGIPQEEYDTVLSERDAAQAEITLLKNNLDAANAQVTSLHSNLSEAKVRINILESDVAEAQSQIESLESRVGSLQSQVSSAQGNYNALKQNAEKARLYGQLLDNYYFVPYFEISLAELIEFTNMVNKTENTKVIDSFNTWMNSGGYSGTQENLDFWITVWKEFWSVLP